MPRPDLVKHFVPSLIWELGMANAFQNLSHNKISFILYEIDGVNKGGRVAFILVKFPYFPVQFV